MRPFSLLAQTITAQHNVYVCFVLWLIIFFFFNCSTQAARTVLAARENGEPATSVPRADEIDGVNGCVKFQIVRYVIKVFIMLVAYRTSSNCCSMLRTKNANVRSSRCICRFESNFVILRSDNGRIRKH